MERKIDLAKLSPSGVQEAYNQLLKVLPSITDHSRVSLYDLADAIQMLADRVRRSAEDTEE